MIEINKSDKTDNLLSVCHVCNNTTTLFGEIDSVLPDIKILGYLTKSDLQNKTNICYQCQFVKSNSFHHFPGQLPVYDVYACDPDTFVGNLIDNELIEVIGHDDFNNYADWIVLHNLTG